jgi:hypothetical protein
MRRPPESNVIAPVYVIHSGESISTAAIELFKPRMPDLLL